MKLSTIACIFGLGLGALVSAEVFLEERFNDGDAWVDRWITSSFKDDYGKVAISHGKWFADEKESVGLQTVEDYRYYALSTALTKPFNNTGKDLVIQFTVKHEQRIDCGGGYIKLYSSSFDPKAFNGDTDYNIMFGPDNCGSKNMVHVILNYNGTNHDFKRSISSTSDVFTHIYTLIVKPDQTYQVLVDGTESAAGNLIEDWDFLPPKTIKDPDASKPEDWVDEATIPDPDDKQPEGWDDIPEFISDPDAVKPEDWDDEMDGDWEAPSIPNPEYKGKWTPNMIDNPEYKGPWVHPEIDNPDYVLDDKIYVYETAYLGIDLWQVKSGSIFDNFLVTDDIEYAEKVRNETWKDLKEKEEKAKDEFDEAEKATEDAKSAADDEDEIESEVEGLTEDAIEGEVKSEEVVVEDEKVIKVDTKPVKDEL